MFSIQEKRDLANKIQELIRATNHPELPSGNIKFRIHIDGAEAWSWADIQDNASVPITYLNPWHELQGGLNGSR
jgi:hypothetical protein